MAFIKECLSDSSDSISMVRVMSLVSLLVGCGIAIAGLCMDKDLGGLAELAAVFVGAAFAAKVGQKIVEGKND